MNHQELTFCRCSCLHMSNCTYNVVILVDVETTANIYTFGLFSKVYICQYINGPSILIAFKNRKGRQKIQTKAIGICLDAPEKLDLLDVTFSQSLQYGGQLCDSTCRRMFGIPIKKWCGNPSTNVISLHKLNLG